MRISITDADGRLAELVGLAKAGEEVILTNEGQGAVCLVQIVEKQEPSVAEREVALERFFRRMASKPIAETEDAVRSQDFLYDENGLPG